MIAGRQVAAISIPLTASCHFTPCIAFPLSHWHSQRRQYDRDIPEVSILLVSPLLSFPHTQPYSCHAVQYTPGEAVERLAMRRQAFLDASKFAEDKWLQEAQKRPVAPAGSSKNKVSKYRERALKGSVAVGRTARLVLPGPGAYDPEPSRSSRRGLSGSIQTSGIPASSRITVTESIMENSDKTPGPGAYSNLPTESSQVCTSPPLRQ